MATTKHIIPGQKFGRLTVIGDAPPSVPKRPTSRPRRRFFAQCECGTIRAYDSGNLVSGNSRSCGCLHNELLAASSKANFTTHGMTGTPEFASWQGAISRCHNPTDDGFKNYGARGIAVCDRWRNSFENFYADMGDRPVGMTIDRIDVNGPYAPSNCRWATDTEQANNRRTNRYIEFLGRTQSLADWAREYGLRREVLVSRLTVLGWPIQKALETPARANKKQGNVFVEHDGKRLTIAEWSRETGIKAVTLYARHVRGWPPERLLAA